MPTGFVDIAYPVVDQRVALQPNGRGVVISGRYPHLVVGRLRFLYRRHYWRFLDRYPGRADGKARDCVNQRRSLIFLLDNCYLQERSSFIQQHLRYHRRPLGRLH